MRASCKKRGHELSSEIMGATLQACNNSPLAICDHSTSMFQLLFCLFDFILYVSSTILKKVSVI